MFLKKGIPSRKRFARRRSVLSNTPPSAAAAAAAALQQHLCNVRYNVIACTALRFQETLSLNTWLWASFEVLCYFCMSCAVFYWKKHFFDGITQLSVFFAYVILTKWYGAPLGYATFHLRLETAGRCDPLVTW